MLRICSSETATKIHVCADDHLALTSKRSSSSLPFFISFINRSKFVGLRQFFRSRQISPCCPVPILWRVFNGTQLEFHIIASSPHRQCYVQQEWHTMRSKPYRLDPPWHLVQPLQYYVILLVEWLLKYIFRIARSATSICFAHEAIYMCADGPKVHTLATKQAQVGLCRGDHGSGSRCARALW